MASWAEFENAAPGLAAEVRRAFAARKHATMATVRRDGSPRISGTEVEFVDGQMVLGMMSGTRRAVDLRADPRYSLHSPTVDPPADDPPAWAGEAKVSGTAREEPGEDSDRFVLDITEAVFTRVGTPADHLLIESWHPDRGVETHRR